MKLSELRNIIRDCINERTQSVYSAEHMIRSALMNGLLTPAEAKSSKVKRAAKDEEYDLNDIWDDDEGFGSSDQTFSIKNMLDGAGLKNKFDKGMLMRVVKGKSVRFNESVSESWFSDMAPTKQKEYVKDHPDSKYSKHSVKSDTEDEPKKLYHIKNSVTGSMLNIRLTKTDFDNKMDTLGSKWKVMSTEQYLRGIIREVLTEVSIESKWNNMSKPERDKFLLKGKFSKKYNDYRFNDLTSAIKKLLGEEKGLTKRFDKIVTTYFNLDNEIKKYMNGFKSGLNTAKDKEKYKKEYIAKLKEMQKKFADAKQSYESALYNLPVPSEKELV